MRKTIGLLVFLISIGLATERASGEGQSVLLAFVGKPAANTWAGVTQGLAEANLQGRFSGQTYQLEKVEIEALLAPSDTPPTAVLAALSPRDLERVSAALKDTPIFNLTAQHDSLRALCRPNLFHVIASQRMIKDAVSQWQSKHPEATVEALTWHHDFKQYAARELNNRFRKAHGLAMDSHAWASWAAVKLLSDAIARTGTTERARLLEYLKEDLEFDGNKGILLNFRSTGQLRQPLLLVEKGVLVGEAPVRGVTDIEDLDSLGASDCPAP
jgi:ABC-type branched-chain amino acid transport systems, periplasmic component